MYTNLTTYDWNRINEIILKMNYEMDILVALKNFLTNVDKLVPYEKASIYFYTLTNDKVNVDTCIENGFNKSDLKRYDEYYCNIDDIVEKMLPTKLKIIRSSDVFDLANRKQTEYYTDYIKPVRTHFSLDSNFRWYKGNEISFGSLDLFRPDRELDFTDKEMAICSILQPHLETKASQYVFSFVDSVTIY